jgi:hypothetical protein
MSSDHSFSIFFLEEVLYPLLFWLFFGLVYLFTTSFFLLIFHSEKAIAWTYDDVWWIGGDRESESAGNIRIIYSYPDQVEVDKPFNVSVTLEYVKDETARSS